MNVRRISTLVFAVLILGLLTFPASTPISASAMVPVEQHFFSPMAAVTCSHTLYAPYKIVPYNGYVYGSATVSCSQKANLALTVELRGPSESTSEMKACSNATSCSKAVWLACSNGSWQSAVSSTADTNFDYYIDWEKYKQSAYTSISCQ